MSELSKVIGCSIRNKRKEKNITQESLALQCGIDRSYMGRIERDEVVYGSISIEGGNIIYLRCRM